MRAAFLTIGLVLATPTVAVADDFQIYTYDVHGRLVRVQHSGTANPGRDTQYAYDDADNRTERERTQPPALTAEINAGGQDELLESAGAAVPGVGTDAAGREPAARATADPANAILD